MSKRVYEREQRAWSMEEITALENDGKATYYRDAGLWVVKLPGGGSVAVRLHQVFDPEWGMTLQDMADQQQAEIWAENAWLRHAENQGWEDAEMERQVEASRGVIPFDEAYDNAMREIRR